MLESNQGAYACLSLLQAGSMRFRWNETNENRTLFFAQQLNSEIETVPLELIHSKIVIAADEVEDTNGIQADGIITCNKNLVPVITVADCMPIYLWEKKTGCFGVLHSGWKGTGIVTEALRIAQEKYGAKAQNFHAIIGPHIKKCCYTIDEERARYFSENYTPECVEAINEGEKKYRLSLERANLSLLEKSGVKKENISVVGECTSCSKNNAGNPIYGSFRRETAHFPPNSPIKEMQKHFTPMAAFICIGENNTLQNTNTVLVHKI